MNDSTSKILKTVDTKRTEHPWFVLSEKTLYNLDDMDPRAYMMNRNMSGCYAIYSKKEIDPEFPGTVWINGNNAGNAVLGAVFRGGQSIGFFVRPFFLSYDTEYQIHYEGAKSIDGEEAIPFDLVVRTIPKTVPGQIHPEHDPIVLQAAEECAVLLKNENHALPLEKGSTVNIFGAGGPSFRLGCVGAGKINPRYGIRIEEGLKTGSTLQLNQNLFEFYRPEKEVYPPEELIAEAKNESETAVYVITRGTGEGVDNVPEKGSYYLTDNERMMLCCLRDDFEKVIVVLNVGFPIEMGWEDEYRIDSVLWCGLPGMAGGKALAEVLEGRVNPSGKLPDSWTYDYWDHPSSKNFVLPDERARRDVWKRNYYAVNVYEEDIYVGYRYFETFNKPVAYPFGFGLSYSRFEKKVESPNLLLDQEKPLCLQIQVTNIGEFPGKEVVQIYAKIPEGKLEQPEKRLVAFEKTSCLNAGESELINIEIPISRFKSYDEDSASWVIESGDIELFIGDDVHSAQKFAVIPVTSEIVLQKVKNREFPPFEVNKLSRHSDKDMPEGGMSRFFESEDLPYRRDHPISEEKRIVKGELPDHLITFSEVCKNPELLSAFVLQLNDEELARMSVGAGTGWGINDNGFAGTLARDGILKKYEIPEYYFSDGNNGLNMFDPTIGFPVSSCMCASFNKELMYQEGMAIAEEAPDLNLHCLLAPAMNLHRNILCGRHSEYFSEDPYLSGVMAGFEGKGFEDGGQSACYKHFFANNAETIRSFSHSIMSERAARELYLKVFEYALEVHEPDSFMTGYNAANGIYCAGDDELLEGILREEWGFSGYVMTDWGSSFTTTPVDTVAAGNSWVAPGNPEGTDAVPIAQALRDGTLDRSRVQRNVYDMLRTIIPIKRRK